MRYEQNNIQNNPENRFDELKKDSQEESCEHMPDTLNLIDTEYQSDMIIHHFECECGKSIEEIFMLTETKVS